MTSNPDPLLSSDLIISPNTERHPTVKLNGGSLTNEVGTSTRESVHHAPDEDSNGTWLTTSALYTLHTATTHYELDVDRALKRDHVPVVLDQAVVVCSLARTVRELVADMIAQRNARDYAFERARMTTLAHFCTIVCGATRGIAEALVHALLCAFPGVRYGLALFAKRRPVTHATQRVMLASMLDVYADAFGGIAVCARVASELERADSLYERSSMILHARASFIAPSGNIGNANAREGVEQARAMLTDAGELVRDSHIACEEMCILLRRLRPVVRRREKLEHNKPVDALCFFAFLNLTGANVRTCAHPNAHDRFAHSIGELTIRSIVTARMSLLKKVPSTAIAVTRHTSAPSAVTHHASTDKVVVTTSVHVGDDEIGVVHAAALPVDAPQAPVGHGCTLEATSFRYYGGFVPRPMLVLVNGTEWMWYERRNGGARKSKPQLRLRRVGTSGQPRFYLPRIGGASDLLFFRVVKRS